MRKEISFLTSQKNMNSTYCVNKIFKITHAGEEVQSSKNALHCIHNSILL